MRLRTAARLLFLAPLMGLVCPSQSSASALTPAHYIVFEIDAAGAAHAIYATRVVMRGSPASVPPGQRAVATERSADAVEVRLRNAAGRVVFETVAGIPRFVRGEFHGPGGTTIDGHLIRQRHRSFAVRVPSIEGAVLELASPALARPARLTLDATSQGSLVTQTRTGTVAALPGWGSGDPANRVDLLVVGDGYTAGEESEFNAHALAVAEGMFSITPYAEYRNFVNVQTLFFASNESGADQPAYDAGCTEYAREQTCCGDTAAADATTAFVDTAFDATFCSYNIDRLLTVNGGKVLIAAADVPDWDQILVIVNSSRYGGSGGSFSVISVNGAAVEVAQHEYGHTFSRLADEYATAYPGYPACSDVDAGFSPCELNVTDQTTRGLVKWEKWIDAAQEVPSTLPPPVATDAGLWEGARYQSSGMYRQGFRCIMRALGQPYCDVAAEAYAMRLYQGAWGVPVGGIDLIEPGSETPPPGNSVEPYPGGTHSVRVLGPIGGPAVSYRWILDDIDVSTGTAGPGDTVAYTMSTTPGLHTLQLRVTDNSDILHPTTRPALARARTWNVEIGPEPTTTTTVSSTTLTTTTLGTTTSTTLAPSTTSTTATTTTTSSTSTTLPPTTTTSAPTSSLPVTSTSTTTTTATSTSTTLHSEPRCAQPMSTGLGPMASDCLYILNAAIGVVACAPECVCAPKGALPTTATDALICLNAAVGSGAELKCPCDPLPTPVTAVTQARDLP